MAGKSVCKEGEVKATAGKKMPEPIKGTWTAGLVTETPYSKLKSAGEKAVYEATCKFTMTDGKAPNGTTATVPPSIVTLSAKPKKLQNGKSNVLVDGDSNKDSYDNELKVSAQGKLKAS